MAESVAVVAEEVHVVASEGPVSIEVDNRARKIGTLSGLPQAAGTAGTEVAGATWTLADGVSTPYEAVGAILRLPNVPQFLGHNGFIVIARSGVETKGVGGFVLGGGATTSVATVDATASLTPISVGIGNAIAVEYRRDPSADTDVLRCVHVADLDVHDPGEPIVVDVWEWQSMPSEAGALAAVNAHLARLDGEFNAINAAAGGPLPRAAKGMDADAPTGGGSLLWSASVLARLVRAVVTAPFVRLLLGRVCARRHASDVEYAAHREGAAGRHGVERDGGDHRSGTGRGHHCGAGAGRGRAPAGHAVGIQLRREHRDSDLQAVRSDHR